MAKKRRPAFSSYEPPSTAVALAWIAGLLGVGAVGVYALVNAGPKG